MISSLFVEENHGGPTRVIDSWELTACITRDTELVFTLGEKCLRKENSAGILIFPFYLFIHNKRTQDLIAYGWMWLEQKVRESNLGNIVGRVSGPSSQLDQRNVKCCSDCTSYDARGPNQNGWQLGAHVVFCALMLIWASQTCLWARIFPKMNGLFWIQ